MLGMDLKSLKKNPSLLPLFACVIVGGIGASGYLIRLATKNPDVTWSRKRNPEPWQEYKTKQYKFKSQVDHSKSPVPEY
ncbi:cytochrome c oxidase subunit NDUFA4 [Microplitis demolitor]|uniref:cytochrome c oxidase subunit NDUFA4 n=1 Tax=Microplitis demolitor TaxID=69319 RepID=UPI0004CCB343|nr:cytochrome c oxidase subunit NDUFA4 [Microplitis demolitor]